MEKNKKPINPVYQIALELLDVGTITTASGLAGYVLAETIASTSPLELTVLATFAGYFGSCLRARERIKKYIVYMYT
jgi:hypothetical protein